MRHSLNLENLDVPYQRLGLAMKPGWGPSITNVSSFVLEKVSHLDRVQFHWFGKKPVVHSHASPLALLSWFTGRYLYRWEIAHLHRLEF